MKPSPQPAEAQSARVHGVDCRPVRELIAKIGAKWSMMIITRLSHGPMRFNALRRDIGGISQKVLTQSLRELERDGFITRTVTPVIPPRVDYALTDLGRDLLVPVNALGAWAVANQARVAAARAAYEQKAPAV